MLARSLPMLLVLPLATASAQIAWQSVPLGPVVPSAREWHTLACDASRQRIVMFGGADASSIPRLDTTWEWNGSSWLQRFPVTSPPPRYGHAMVYDSARQRIVVFGGQDTTPTVLSDTWEWDGANWLPTTPASSPTGRIHFGMAFDSVRQCTVLFGGNSTSPGLGVLGDTWEWNGTTWSNRNPGTDPGARQAHAMVFDETAQRTLLFGGSNPSTSQRNDLWSWDGTTWLQISSPNSPGIRHHHAMAYDAANGVTVLQGGCHAGGQLRNDSWLWDGFDWAPIPGAQLTPARALAAMTHDTARGRTFLFGGRDGCVGLPSESVLADVWQTSNPTFMTLDFNNAVPGTLADSTGQGVGFTNRLPGTGSGIPANDPNLVLAGGVLAITSQQANLESVPQTNPHLIDAPCIVFNTCPTESLEVLARLRNVSVANGSDHAGIILGTSASSWLSVYVHETSHVVLTEWNVPPASQGVRHYLASGCFAVGDDVDLRLTRTGGQWQAHWHNLTTNASGSSLPVSIPWLDAAPVLHAGVGALNTGTPIPFVTQLDVFEVHRGPLATATMYGSGCGNPALSLLPIASSPPRIGAMARASVLNSPQSLAFVAVGWNNTAIGPFAIPFPLAGYGMNGCQLWHSADAAAQPVTFHSSGTATYSLALPNWCVLLGVHIYLQGWAPASGTNPAGVIVSNGLDWGIGL